jgi:hypothetical protein
MTPIVPHDTRYNTHMAGEFFVAAELSKRGYLVSLTMGNAKAVDLFVERAGKAVCIQVKTIDSEQRRSWPLPSNRERITNGIMFVCVVLNGVGKSPTYYVLPPQEVRKRGKWYATLPVLDIGAIRDGNFLDAWQLIDAQLAAPSVEVSSIVERTVDAVRADEGSSAPPGSMRRTRGPSERGSQTIALCSRPQGATGKELREATGAPRGTPWKYDIEGLARRYGYVLRVARRDGVSCYHLDPARPRAQ